MIRRTLMVVCMVGLLLSALPAGAQDYTPRVEWGDCPFPVPEGEEIECGVMIVPQDRSQPTGTQVELAFAILYATGDAAAPDALVDLEGGPGDSALAALDLWRESPFRTDHDIVLFDQRGTGYSVPRLYCYEIDELGDYSADEADARATCLDRLESEDGVDLTAYNSAASAADVADLRVALGYDAWNLYGVSYGTRLALTVMRDHPEGVRSVILDSTYPPVVDAYEEEPATAYRAFRQLFDDCAADAACSSAYPNLESRFYALVDRLNADPLYVESMDADLYGDDLVSFLFEQFYNTSALPYLPLLIDELDQGMTGTLDALQSGDLAGGTAPDPVADLVAEFDYLTEDMSDDDYYDMLDELADLDPGEWGDVLYTYFNEDDAGYLADAISDLTTDQLDSLYFQAFGEDVSSTDGMFDALECNEEVPFNSFDDIQAQAAAVPPQIGNAMMGDFEQIVEACAQWDSGVADSIEDEAITSSIPTLVIAGLYDPVTPPTWGQLAAQTLPNSVYVEFPGVGHGVIDGGDCPVSIMLAFLAAPDAPPDTTCVAQMSAPDFVLP